MLLLGGVAVAAGSTVRPPTASATGTCALAGYQYSYESEFCFEGTVHTGAFVNTTQASLTRNTGGEGVVFQGITDYSGCGDRLGMYVSIGNPYQPIGTDPGDNYQIVSVAEDSRGYLTTNPDEYTVPDGRGVALQIQFTKANTYQVLWWDGDTKVWHTGPSYGYLGDGSCESDIGGQEDGTDKMYSDQTSGTFNFTGAEWRDTGNAWHVGSYGPDNAINIACGSPPCFNAQDKSSSQWIDNINT